MPLIETSVRDAVATITLNRPEKLNAFGGTMREDLLAALKTAAGNRECRVVVITGAGRAFCAGGDVDFMSGLQKERNTAAFQKLLDAGRDVILQIATMEKPVIAAVNGAAAGAGMSIACACDLRIAADSASFIPAFINIGLIPDSGGTYFISGLLGYARAFEWMTSGRKLSAAEAHAWGLVSEVVEADALAGRAAELAAQSAALPTRGVGLTKRLFSEAEHNTLEEQLELEAELQSAATQTADFREGVAAFLEKREPKFTGT